MEPALYKALCNTTPPQHKACTHYLETLASPPRLPPCQIRDIFEIPFLVPLTLCFSLISPLVLLHHFLKSISLSLSLSFLILLADML